MRDVLRITTLCALVALTALSTFAQSRPKAGTVIDVDQGHGRLQIEYEDRSRVTVETDSISTVYYGFGTMIAGKPEIFKGSSGLSNVRLGDRIDVRGSERGEGILKADRITLLGRDVAAGTVGVGTTREPTSVSTQTDDRTATNTAVVAGGLEGTIRSINEEDGRLVIQTAQRRMLTVRTYRSTPVLYQGQTYRISNLEVGDRIRIEAETSPGQGEEVTARRITVVQSVQDAGTTPAGGRVTTIAGRVVRVEPGLDRVFVDDGRDEIRVDMAQAEDASGSILRARDLRIDDLVEITGSYNRIGDAFNASTVRFTAADREFPGTPGGAFDQPAIITTGGVLIETLEDASTLGLRETDTNVVVRIWTSSDLVVRTKGNTFVTAFTLRANDSVLIQAFRDARGNLIAQTIRLRNR